MPGNHALINDYNAFDPADWNGIIPSKEKIKGSAARNYQRGRVNRLRGASAAAVVDMFCVKVRILGRTLHAHCREDFSFIGAILCQLGSIIYVKGHDPSCYL